MGGTLFDHVTPEMRIYQEEILGPVLAVVCVPSYTETVKLINEHAIRKGAAIFTCDGDETCNFCTSYPGRHGRGQRTDLGARGMS
ncbi:aldehyde dehydrogenase family protein [Crenobacter oryzisoli]|uniref:aldehyde dehydrogenase family protein n=1 Tax=Crenobacter oryzisoli TaxID=3056844 RepID=UPI00338E8093